MCRTPGSALLLAGEQGRRTIWVVSTFLPLLTWLGARDHGASHRYALRSPSFQGKLLGAI